jgi:hypothetical protein
MRSSASAAAVARGAFERVCRRRGVGDDLVLRAPGPWLLAPRGEVDGEMRDTKDRIEMAAALLVDMVAEGR